MVATPRYALAALLIAEATLCRLGFHVELPSYSAPFVSFHRKKLP